MNNLITKTKNTNIHVYERKVYFRQHQCLKLIGKEIIRIMKDMKITRKWRIYISLKNPNRKLEGNIQIKK